MAAEALQSHPEFSQGSRRNASSFPPTLSPAALLDVPSSFPLWPILNPPEIFSCTEGWGPFFFLAFLMESVKRGDWVAIGLGPRVWDPLP